MVVTGRVVEEQKNYFVVDTPSGLTNATTLGILKQKRKRVCTGDIVDIKLIDSTPPQRGVITAIHQRTSFIKRPTLANCTHMLCVCTFKEPPLNLEILDQLLFTVQVYGLEPCIVINKIDTHNSKEQKEIDAIAAAYKKIGFPVFSVSSITREGIEPLITYCTGKTSACAGLSGVGKSTMLSAIFPDKHFRIGELSPTANRGTHTTTNVTLLRLGESGFIADTPGLAMIDLPAIPKDEVVLYFPELAACIGKCRFNNCIHDCEPGCAIIKKMNNGAIARWRHTHYLKIYNIMREKRKKYR